MTHTPSASGPGTGECFPSTLWSDLLSLRDPAAPAYRQNMERLIQRYWKPVYRAIWRSWTRSEEDARDLTQEFFLLILQGELVVTAAPERGSFRRYLKTALRHFLINRKKAAQRIKRGGGHAVLRLNFDEVKGGLEPADASDSPEMELDRAWAHQLLSEALAELRAQLLSKGELAAADIFQAYDLAEAERPSCKALALRYNLPEHQVWQHLETARRILRTILLKKMRDYVWNESELFRELNELF